MENIIVEECVDSGGNIVVQLRTALIGWTYNSYIKSCTLSVSSKYLWNEEQRIPWNNLRFEN